jgi:hypothetical protein
MSDLVGQIMDYESGEMGQEEAVSFFQGLINSGMAWTLQGHYGRTATALIEAGYCTARESTKGGNCNASISY